MVGGSQGLGQVDNLIETVGDKRLHHTLPCGGGILFDDLSEATSLKPHNYTLGYSSCQEETVKDLRKIALFLYLLSSPNKKLSLECEQIVAPRKFMHREEIIARSEIQQKKNQLKHNLPFQFYSSHDGSRTYSSVSTNVQPTSYAYIAPATMPQDAPASLTTDPRR